MYVGVLVPFLNWTPIFDWYLVHIITQLMSCVHMPSSIFKNKASGCRNPYALD